MNSARKMTQTKAFTSNQALTTGLQTGAVQPGAAGCHPARLEFNSSLTSDCRHSRLRTGLKHNLPWELQQIISPACYTTKWGCKAVSSYRGSFLLASQEITT